MAAAAAGLIAWYGMAGEPRQAGGEPVAEGAGEPPGEPPPTRPEDHQVREKANEAAGTVFLGKRAFDTPRRATAEAPVRVPLSYEHRELIKYLLNSPNDPHAQLEAEHKDAAWAFPLEHTLKVGFQEEASKGFEVYSAECRATICEFQLFGPDGTSIEDMSEALKRHLPFEPMGLSFASGTADGRFAFISFVFRDDARDRRSAASR